jgi:hypothetical protein
MMYVWAWYEAMWYSPPKCRVGKKRRKDLINKNRRLSIPYVAKATQGKDKID